MITFAPVIKPYNTEIEPKLVFPNLLILTEVEKKKKTKIQEKRFFSIMIQQHLGFSLTMVGEVASVKPERMVGIRECGLGWKFSWLGFSPKASFF